MLVIIAFLSIVSLACAAAAGLILTAGSTAEGMKEPEFGGR